MGQGARRHPSARAPGGPGSAGTAAGLLRLVAEFLLSPLLVCAPWPQEQKEYTRWLKRVGDFVKA